MKTVLLKSDGTDEVVVVSDEAFDELVTVIETAKNSNITDEIESQIEKILTPFRVTDVVIVDYVNNKCYQ